jgi:hypothetical protein
MAAATTPATSGGVQEMMTDCWAGTVQWASDAGTWVLNGLNVAAVWLKDAALWLGDKAYDGWVWLSQNATAAWNWITAGVVKAYEVAAPIVISFAKSVQQAVLDGYQFVIDFVQKHPNETITGVACLAIGAVAALVIERCCC